MSPTSPNGTVFSDTELKRTTTDVISGLDTPLKAGMEDLRITVKNHVERIVYLGNSGSEASPRSNYQTDVGPAFAITVIPGIVFVPNICSLERISTICRTWNEKAAEGIYLAKNITLPEGAADLRSEEINTGRISTRRNVSAVRLTVCLSSLMILFVRYDTYIRQPRSRNSRINTA